MCGGILFCVLFVFILFGLLIAILPLMGVDVEMLHLVYCGIGVLIFSIYLIYDTQVQLCDLATDFYLKKIRTYLPWYTMFTPPDDDGRQPQVLDLPGGVHLRSHRHLP